MTTTIDKAGRVVIPADVRRRMGFRPGTELEVIEEDYTVRLRPAVSPPKVIRRGGRRVVVPTVPADEREPLDVPARVEAERDRWPT